MTIITIDGPSGAGKGTVALGLAKHFNFDYLDSGALYRIVALDALNKSIDLTEHVELTKIALNLKVEFKMNALQTGVDIILDGLDVTDKIRTESIASMASKIASLTTVRESLLERQRKFYDNTNGLIADGRDMGTVVFPDADAKIFLTASAETRADRRFNQLKDKGVATDRANILAEIKARDDRDMNRKLAPLKPAKDAILIDNSSLSIDATLREMIDLLTNQL